MKRLISIFLFLFFAIVPSFAQKSFDMRYSEAVEYYTSKQYDLAVKTLEAAKKAPGATESQKTRADQLIRQCRSAITKLGDLNLSKEVIMAPGSGMRDSIYVTAGKKWSITSKPAWCSTEVESDVIFISVAPNQEDESRKGVIEVSMGKERTAYLLVTQDSRQTITKPVTIRTIPSRAMIYVDQNSGMLTEQFHLSEGKHNIRIEKNGFEPIDTVLYVPRNAKEDDLVHFIELKPTFSLISINIKPEEGLYFNSSTTVDISGNSVDLHPSQLRTFNVDQDIRYYELYEGNLIPLHPGQYVIRAESNGFKFEVKQIKIEKGETINLDFTLSAIYGMLRVVDTGNAQGAKVIVDDKEIGVVPFYGKMMTGHHSLRIDKSGFLPEYESYEFDVEEGKEVVANVSMNRYATYRFTSNPEYSQIFVDGEPMGVTPISVKLKEGVHQLSCQKQGYRANDEEIATDLSSETHDFTFNMEKTYPLLISSDVDSLKVTITKGQGKKRVVYVDDVKTPATVEIPASKTMYHVLLTRGNLSKAYDGYFWFRDGNRKHLKLLSYPIENTCLLGVNYYLKKPKPFLGDTAFEKEFQRLGEVTFAEIQLFPGFTSSVAKGAFFWPTQSQQIVYPANDKGRYGLRPGDDLYRDVSFIPALTLLFLNDEFRIGGALHHNVDLDFLASYAWYPSLVRIMPFNHMSGHDIFVGGEISSRIPIFTASIRVGVQAFYGNVNICRPSGVMPNSATTEDRYISEPYVIPYNQAQGVVSLCMKLGSKNFKGNNILRVF